MHYQKSFQQDLPCLYLVATPIGNLSEMTPRAIETLQNVDVIACEDTRTSGVLLNYFNIKKKLISYHNFNEKESTNGIIELLKQGNKVALISDAGYPLFSDPGTTLVKKVLEHQFPVIPISGSNAAINALVASGIAPQPFYFFGFLNASMLQRQKQLKKHAEYDCTLVYYESPHRIQKTLSDMYAIFGERNICIARELTKKHEEFIRGKLSDFLEISDLKGEIVLIVEGKKEEVISQEIIIFELNMLIQSGESKSYAIKKIAKKYEVSKNELYALVHENQTIS